MIDSANNEHVQTYKAQTSSGYELQAHFSQVVIVDLAGNERAVAHTGAPNEASLKAESIHVNESLSALNACICHCAKTSSKASSVNHAHQTSFGAGLYRVSLLTRLLKELLIKAKIIFLACCSPLQSSAVMTGQTLAYAKMVKRIKTNAEDSAVLLVQRMDRFPIEFLPNHVLLERGYLPQSSEGLTVYLHELCFCIVRVMISHR